jgi:hypothetical protein
LIGVGAAGNKAVVNAVEKGVVKESDTVIVNSTSKDFPASYKGTTIILSPNDTGCGKEISIAEEYAIDAIKQGKYAPVPNTVIVQDLQALGAYGEMLQPK